MRSKARLATLVLLGALPLAGIGADYGGLGTGSTSAQSGTAPGSASSPNVGTQGGPSGNDTTSGAAPGSMGSPASSHVPGQASSSDLSVQFGNLDKNGDGTISRSEIQDSRDLSARFDQMDTNRDGQLSFSELQAGQSATGAAGVSGSSRGGAPSPELPSDTGRPGGSTMGR